MDSQDQALQALKEKMTPEQRQDMADLLKAELKRRELEKGGNMSVKKKSAVGSSRLSSGLGREELGEMYQDMGDDVRQMRLQSIERRLADARSQAKRLEKAGKLKKKRKAPKFKVPKGFEHAAGLEQFARSPFRLSKNAMLVLAIAALALAKVVLSTGVVDASIGRTSEKPLATPLAQKRDQATEIGIGSETSVAPAMTSASRERVLVAWTPAEKEILTALDSRRVDLEKRKNALDEKESELAEQTQALKERLVELRALTAKLGEQRKVRDQRYEARLEQLANVYSSMAPKEAAPLIARLDDTIALQLLERMPGKRIGQILGLMSPERAIELTQYLTDKKAL